MTGRLAELARRFTDIIDSLSASHTQNTDTILDEGGANEMSAEVIKAFIDIGYERNTWTPAFVDTNVVLEEAHPAEYIRIGDLIIASFDFIVEQNSVGGGTAQFLLPFNGIASRFGVGQQRDGVDNEASTFHMSFLTTGANRVGMRGIGDTGLWSYNNPNLSVDCRLEGTITYIRQ